VDPEKYNGKKFPEYAGLLCGISHPTLNEKRNPIKQNLKKKKDTSQNKQDIDLGGVWYCVPSES
jgi:hypothetical protein